MSKSYRLFRSNITVTWLFLSSHAQPSFYFCRYLNTVLPSHYKWNLLSPQLLTGSSKDCVHCSKFSKGANVAPFSSTFYWFSISACTEVERKLLIANFGNLCTESSLLVILSSNVSATSDISVESPAASSHSLQCFPPGTAFLCWVCIALGGIQITRTYSNSHYQYYCHSFYMPHFYQILV